MGGTGDRTCSTECKYYGLGTLKWERHVSHGSLPRRDDISADSKGQVGFKREKGIEMVVQGEKGALAQEQWEGSHSRNVSGSFKVQAKKTGLSVISPIFVLRFSICSSISSML